MNDSSVILKMNYEQVDDNFHAPEPGMFICVSPIKDVRLFEQNQSGKDLESLNAYPKTVPTSYNPNALQNTMFTLFVLASNKCRWEEKSYIVLGISSQQELL